MTCGWLTEGDTANVVPIGGFMDAEPDMLK